MDKTDIQYVLYDKATHHKFESLRKYCIKGMGAYVFLFSKMNKQFFYFNKLFLFSFIQKNQLCYKVLPDSPAILNKGEMALHH